MTLDSSLKIFSISNIKFTRREVDVLACVIHNRKEKKIAELLSISPRTVESHIVNIRMKLTCASKDSLIDCLEASDQVLFLNNHYCKLLIHNAFLMKLSLIKKLLSSKKYKLEIRTKHQHKSPIELIQKITKDLDSIGIQLYENSKSKKEGDDNLENAILCFLPSEHQTQSVYVTNKERVSNIEHIDFSDKFQYMTNLLYLIKAITNIKEINNIIIAFVSESKNLNAGFFSPNINAQGNNITTKHKPKAAIILIWSFIYILLAGITIFSAGYIFNKKDSLPITSTDLETPRFYLQRDEILKQMDKLLSAPNQINTIALVGMGGSGKTTLALQYANTQNASIVWKINAETPTSTMISLEGLAYALCKTPLDKEEFYNIQKIGDIHKKEYMISIFLKNKAPLYKKWIMIYDNVSNFSDIQILLPRDIKSWGSEGKVIITTANSNISNNNYFSNQNIVYIPELNEQEKIKLYTHILGINNTDYKEDPNIQILLNNIPPFPLDVAQAAHYIRSTGITLSQYIKHVTKMDDDFLNLEKSIFNNISNYTNTRNNIVELSLKMIQQQQKEASDLLLLLSIIDIENIPKSLLIAYKSEIIINTFLQNMQNFSLIKHDNQHDKTLSLHQSIQANFLKNINKSIKEKDYDDIALFFINFIEKELQADSINEDLVLLIPHLETLLDHYYFFSVESVFAIRNIVGNLYNQCLNDLPKALNILEYARIVSAQTNNVININLIKNSIYLNNIYYKSGNLKKAEEFLVEAEQAYKSKLSADISPYLDSLLRKARINQQAAAVIPGRLH
jgi:DNA-binding CsgD family transcriptional regulator